MNNDKPHLRRVMGFWDLLFFYIATSLSLRWMATAAAAGPSSLVIWVIAAMTFFVPLALTVLELSSRYPAEGGVYVWTRHAFGGFAGFMSGWTYWAANLPYFPGLLYFAAGNALFMGGENWQHLNDNSMYFMAVALGGLLVGVVLNVIGLDVGKWLHNASAVSTWIPAVTLIALGATAWLRFGSATDFSAATLLPSTNLKDVIFWSTIAFAFGGVESASIMSEEIHEPRDNIPRAVLVSGAAMAMVYIMGTLAVLIAVPESEVSGLQGFMQAIASVAAKLGLSGILPATALLVTVSSVGAVSAWFAATARLPFVAGVDRFLPPVFAKLHPRWGTPYVAIVVQAVIAAIFIVLGQAGTTVKGAYEFLVSMGVIAYFIPFLFMFAAMARIQREPAGREVMRVPGGQTAAVLLASVGFLTTLISVILAMIPPDDEPNKPLAVLKIIGTTAVTLAIGAAIYIAGRRK